MRFLSAITVFSAACGVAFGQGYPPDKAASKMTLPDGFQVELVASEPLVRQPVAIDFDERDLRIQRKADRAGDAAFTVITIACIVLLIALPAERLEWWLAPLIAAQVLIGLLIARTLSEYAYLVVSYMRERV